MNDASVVFIAIAITIAVFLVLREFWTWYWKINKLIQGQAETNRLLNKLLNVQLTGKPYGDVEGEIIIEDATTGEQRGISKTDWQKVISKNPKQTKYRIVKENRPPNADD